MGHNNNFLSDLFDKVYKQKATRQEKELADSWYNQLDLHEKAAFSDQKQKEQTRLRMLDNLTRHIHKRSTLQIFPLWVRSIAAAVIISILSFVTYSIYQSATKPQIYMAVASSENFKKVMLPDGSEVTLNRKAQISWDSDFDKQDRKVSLIGEAFFNVKKDTGHPFLLKSGNISTRVTGTSFNVEYYEQESQIKISLVAGIVKITDLNTPQHHTILKPGQMMVYDKDHGKMEVKSTAVDDPSAWINGGLVFNDIPLVTALDRISKRYGIDIECNNGQLQDKTITVSLTNVSWKEALQAVLFMHDLKFHEKKKGVITVE